MRNSKKLRPPLFGIADEFDTDEYIISTLSNVKLPPVSESPEFLKMSEEEIIR